MNVIETIPYSLISVIIPCYNCQNYLHRAIESVFQQSYAHWEILLVDNNSTDETAAILKKYKSQYPEKIHLLFELEKGAPFARNKGLRHAQGEWIQFLDADDELLPDKLSGQLALALKESASIIASPYTIKGKKNGKAFQSIRELNTNDFWVGLIYSRLGITSANLFNTEILKKVNGWDGTLVSSQEYDLMFRMLQISPIVGLDNRNLTIIYIEQGESVSRGGDEQKGLRMLESRIGLRLRIKKYLSQHNLLTPERLIFIDKFVYRQLIENYRFRPKYVKENLKSLQLKVSMKEWFEGMYFMLKMDLKGLLKKVNK